MKNYLSLIKFSHTIFALPFAIIGFFLAVYMHGYLLRWDLLFLMLCCMIFARSAAMAFNRYLDRDIDILNPRTAVREIPSGIIKPKNALAFTIINALLFIGTTAFINPLCLILSPVALIVILGYSYTKRFTSLCHLVLGLGLALAPIGAYLTVAAAFHWLPLLFSAIVFLWVSGFDIIYALQDEDFDKNQKLHSIPTLLGKANALKTSTILHIICGSIVILAGILGQFGYLFWIGAISFNGLLIYQHTLISVKDLSKINLAFFTTNGVASVILATFILLDLTILF